MEKYRNTYRIPSARLQDWDYSWAGAYFITICTQNRAHYFGEIASQQMTLSHIGIIADILWHQIPHHAHHVELGAFVVMPNHIHGILVITQDENVGGHGNENVGGNVETGHALSLQSNNGGNKNVGGNVETGHTLSLQSNNGGNKNVGGNVETGHALSLQSNNATNYQTEHITKTIGQQRFQKIGKNSISSMVGSYKSAVTKHAHRLGFDFQWQTRFYDHIIRDNESFQKISNYIINNPAHWQNDKFFNEE